MIESSINQPQPTEITGPHVRQTSREKSVAKTHIKNPVTRTKKNEKGRPISNNTDRGHAVDVSV